MCATLRYDVVNLSQIAILILHMYLQKHRGASHALDTRLLLEGPLRPNNKGSAPTIGTASQVLTVTVYLSSPCYSKPQGIPNDASAYLGEFGSLSHT